MSKIEFYSYATQYDRYCKVNGRRSYDIDTFYKLVAAERKNMYQEAVTRGVKEEQVDILLNDQFEMAEHRWIEARRPYYRVYPCVLPAFSRLDLHKVPIGRFQAPSGVQELMIYLPVGNALLRSGQDIRAIMLVIVPTIRPEQHSVLMGCYVGEDMRSMKGGIGSPQWGKLPLYWTDDPAAWDCKFTKNAVLGDVVDGLVNRMGGIDAATTDAPMRVADIATVARLAMTLCLLNESSSLLQPDFLTGDEDKLDFKTHWEKYQARAHKRGKVGWTVGEEMQEQQAHRELSPHLRMAHPHMYWCGKGRTKLEFRWIDTIQVKPRSLTDVPMGYEADEQDAFIQEESDEDN